MNALLKPTRRARVERFEPSEAMPDDSHSWAVSYADFLMVLLSFFVIFFSIDGDKKEQIFNKLTMGTPAPAQNKPNGTDKIPQGVTAVVSNMDGLYVTRPDEKQKIYIYFEDNIYPPGQLDLQPQQIDKLKGILGQLEPFMKEINITFIGHTDSTTVSASRNRFISDNFDLSSLRATKALQQAVKAGFNPEQMFAKGVAEHARGTRTLSLIISPSGDD